MCSKANFLGLIFMLVCITISAQLSYIPIYRLQIEAVQFRSDKLQYGYLVDANNRLQKYAADGSLLFEYTNNTLGEIGNLDTTDPFNIALFYPDFLTIIFLDRTLTETQRISLLDAGFFDVQAIGLSMENQVWLYDANDFRLKKINAAGNVTQQSSNLSLLFDAPLVAQQIQEYDNKVYVLTADLGVLIFDVFGNYISRLNFKNLTQFQLMQGQLLFLENNELHSYHLLSKLSQNLALPLDKNITHFQFQKKRLYIQTTSGIAVYEVKNKIMVKNE